MFSKIFAAAALTVVSAADVPIFSSNDDYDEINLNIRMLSNTTHTLSAKAKIVGSFPDGTTARRRLASLSDNTAFKTGFCNAVKTALDAHSPTGCLVNTITDASRRARELATSLTLEIGYAVTFATAAASAAAKTVVDDTSAGSAFATALTNNLATAVAAAGGPAITGVTATSSGTTTASSTTGAAAAAAAPSPSPSSNAAKVVLSGFAAVFAMMAAMM